MNTFILPTSPNRRNQPGQGPITVSVMGTEVNRLGDMENIESPGEYSDTQGGTPNWQLSTGGTIEATLQAPLVYAITEEDGSISVYSEIWIKQDAIPSLSIVLYHDENNSADTLSVVACYTDEGVPSTPLEKSYAIQFSIPPGDAEEIANLEMYLFREDPVTSRGTVTTVQHQTSDENKLKEESSIKS